MLHEQDLQGVYVPVVTPFLPNEELDPESYHRYISGLLNRDIQGIVVNGTTGEAPTVTWTEVSTLVQITRLCMMSRQLPLVVGTGTNNTAETVKRTEQAGMIGADAVLVVTPYYSLPSQAGIVEHFRRVAQVGVPVIAYEIPARTGVALSADTLLRILDLDGVIGLKDSSGGTSLCTALAEAQSKPILCGEDRLLLAMLQQGAHGGMLASANLQTNSFAQVCRLAASGAYEQAQELFHTLLPLIHKLFQESNPAPLKWLLARQGLIASDQVRPPMGSVSSSLEQELALLVSGLPV
ncbi:4-hydroxy-tetrahydrodipicolinate synthase [Paenibacillus phyllosphaerae]|uniref:4-hydroxy-tetrahydrodipicolinate synthase n=1 Tax=Paenibacillus phyllosphaerae TaxID=274593 RepID=A0A7W5FLE4_9BACL|nr:4-hydroxy-tetrahydrodipicolinate synthase [Paenibacillus phyllosphaerae]MBB3108912.1 4-hydroxy-tetrahydrodipicolinate synthase [Paenibacillus phyllosphaerae]